MNDQQKPATWLDCQLSKPLTMSIFGGRINSGIQHATKQNMDFRQRVVVETERQDWFVSSSSKVRRKPLEREAAEQGHTTSIVRFGAGSHFPRRQHPLGEDILVLDGVFSDEHGDYGPGCRSSKPVRLENQ